MAITFIRTTELELIARRVWNAKFPKGKRQADGSKCSSFEAIGFRSQSTEFPMRSGEWVQAGQLEIKIFYPKWDIPGYIWVRRPTKDIQHQERNRRVHRH